MTKILLTGARGQLGKEIEKYSNSLYYQPANNKKFDFSFIDIEELDLTDSVSVKTFFIKNKFDFIINTAAYTAVDRAEEEEETALRVNAGILSNITDSIRNTGSKLIHISTDYVFDGKAGSPYTEQSPVNPETAYGRTKLEGEKICLDYPMAMVIRTSWLYSAHANNFVNSIIKKGKEQDSLKVVNDQYGSPTFAAHLARAILKIIDLSSANDKTYKAGIYHYTNTGSCSWFEFAEEIRKLAGLQCRIIAVSSDEYPLPAKRPLYSIMSKEKICRTFHLSIPHWKDGLAECLDEMK